MRTLPLLRETKGLRNVVDPARISYSPERGLEYLAAAVNVDIDDSGRISRRKGQASTDRIEATRCLFCEGGIGLAISGTALYRVWEDMSWLQLKTGLTPGARMGYARVKDRVYYSNGFERGYVEGNTNFSWVRGAYVGPTMSKVLYDPPLGHLLDVGLGRMFIGRHDVLWWSRRFDYSAFDLARDYMPLEEGLRMVGVVEGGVFISTDREIVFLRGKEAVEFEYAPATDYPAIEGTMIRVDGSLIGDGSIQGRVIIFATKRGICLGGAGGRFMNLTGENIILPDARYGSGLIIGGKYVCLLES